MLQFMLEKLNQQLHTHGMISDIVLRSDHSLLEEAEGQEVLITFSEAEDEKQPTATIHLFSLAEEDSCEIEVEIDYPYSLQDEEIQQLWTQAKSLVAECSLTEKRRFVEPGTQAEAKVVLDYHFVVQMPRTEAEEIAFTETIARFSADLGMLVKLGT
ncbi:MULTISPECIES: hypothetical protein [Brevibacillus]|uniref:Uncharacterized protein n=1 Tax=Brevibacillus porteri TaxID=2126350 RepID=A0ABX5FMF2_9BACL|nr:MULTISPECIES: hypothetical protein [Brevibacillus]MDC0760114.1 hypothetical protein [Brevibacillus sp. AG]MED1800162.1 hypothetical protein [Brevibacillus porteri]MED2131779.1 hypothetical protein [Brevibacillus porteri]MED2748026.1 hypothetical protein [Brevibacillus porteri]MED2812328.1 hypothetical protein [Brevibacillus porteri]